MLANNSLPNNKIQYVRIAHTHCNNVSNKQKVYFMKFLVKFQEKHWAMLHCLLAKVSNWAT